MTIDMTTEFNKLMKLIEINKDLNRYYQTLIPDSTYLPQNKDLIKLYKPCYFRFRKNYYSKNRIFKYKL